MNTVYVHRMALDREKAQAETKTGAQTEMNGKFFIKNCTIFFIEKIVHRKEMQD